MHVTNKRIAMISYHTCPLASFEGKETGGMNVYVLELSRALVQRGYTIDMYTRCQAPDNPTTVDIEPNLRLVHLPAGPPGSVLKKHLVGFIQEFSMNMDKFMRENGLSYDVFHCHYYMSGLVGLELQNVMKRPLPMVMSFHTLGLMKNLVARNEFEHEEEERISAEFLLMKEAKKVIAVSDMDFGYMYFLYGVPKEKLVIISPGVDTKLFAPMDRFRAREHIGVRTGKLILFVGRVEPLKGADLLLYALKILVTKNPGLHVCLLIVGGDVSDKPVMWSKPLKSLEELRKTLDIPAIVKFVGQEPQQELPYYYNAADVVVMPSHYESFGMVALEAMACGVPVVTTDVMGVSSLLDEKHRSLITSVNNPFLLAAQIEKLLTNETYYRKVSAEIQKDVQDLNWTSVAEQIDHVYDGLQ